MVDFVDGWVARDQLLELDTGDLAGLLVEYLHSLPADQRRNAMRTSFVAGDDMVKPGPRRQDVSLAVVEAWAWLIQEGLVVPRPLNTVPDCYTFSREGETLKTRSLLAQYRERARMPKELLQTVLVQKSWPLYLKGEYDTAVFQAFKEVEVAVRSAGGYTDNDFGLTMIRNAFRAAGNTAGGPLHDATEPAAEQEALSNFVAGAYARVRNPTAHRHGVLNDPTEAFEMLVIASHLLRIVEKRKSPAKGN